MNGKKLMVQAILVGFSIGQLAAMADSVSEYKEMVLTEINHGERLERLNKSEANNYRAQHKAVAKKELQCRRKHAGALSDSDTRVLEARWKELYDRVMITEGLK